MITTDVLVITGAGGMGTAVARRLGSGRPVLLADISAAALERESGPLRDAGYAVTCAEVDIADSASIARLVAAAMELGAVTTVVHTAGLSPVQSTVQRILEVDLVGTALLVDAFGAVIAPGGAGVVVSSMAGTMTTLDPVLEQLLAITPSDELLRLDALDPVVIGDTRTAYGVAKRANQIRMWPGSLVWGARGARLNSLSPGMIITPMGLEEFAGPNGDMKRAMLRASALQRTGTPDDIAAVVEFLTGPTAGFITGTDFLVDGGVVSALRAGVTLTEDPSASG